MWLKNFSASIYISLGVVIIMIKILDLQEARSYADENRLLFLETSAKTGTNVNELFLLLGQYNLRPVFLSHIFVFVHRISQFPNVFISFICVCIPLAKILNDEHINKQARKSSNFRLLLLNIPCCFGLFMVNYKFFRHIRASYFSFNTFSMNVNVVELK